MDKGFAVLEIDQEFKNLIRPLRKDEYLQLEVNLTIDGCRDPIITWNNIIIDGHNRYEICNRLRIPYAVREMPFESRDQAIVWICNNQLGRRNISEETRRYLIGKQYELEKVARKNPPNINGFNQYKQRNKKERGESFRRTAQKLSTQYPMKIWLLFQKCRRRKSGESDLSQKIFSAHLPATAIHEKSFWILMRSR